MSGGDRFNTYRGKSKSRKVLTAVAWILAAVLALAVGFYFYAQQYVVYDDQGNVHLQLPFFRDEHEPEPTPDQGRDIVVVLPTPSPAPTPTPEESLEVTPEQPSGTPDMASPIPTPAPSPGDMPSPLPSDTAAPGDTPSPSPVTTPMPAPGTDPGPDDHS